MPIAHACFVLDRVRMAGPSYAGLGSGSGLVGEGSSELGSELQNCWVAFEHAGDGGCFFGEPSAASSSGSVSESSSYGMASAPRTGSEDDRDRVSRQGPHRVSRIHRQDRITSTNVAKTCLTLVVQTPCISSDRVCLSNAATFLRF